jgi:hypothetical protein
MNANSSKFTVQVGSDNGSIGEDREDRKGLTR